MIREGLFEMAGEPDEWAMIVVYRNDGRCIVWGRDDLEPAEAARAVAETAASMAVKFPGGDVPDGWNGHSGS